ncbi:MAG: hypothetical protein ABI537_05695 [Casimicrobiaceae bacterium]
MKPATLVATLLAGVLALWDTNAHASATLSVPPLFPANNIWNRAIDTLPVDARSDAYVATIGATRTVHPDFGTVYAGAPNGIPYSIVPSTQPRVAVTFMYSSESDPGPYPIPPDALIEGGPQSNGDRHVLIVDRDAHKLYELFAAYPNGDGTWRAGSGAIFDFSGNALRTAGWTSADAAGLPIVPGLVRYEEVFAGEIPHALRFTAPQTRNTYVWPARHQASSLSGLNYPPMGQRFRLKASVNISSFGPNVQVILRALKKYGMFLADNGSSWYLSGAPDPRWSDDELHQLGALHGSDFEAVDASALMVNPNSGQAAAAAVAPGQEGVAAVEYYCAATDRYLTSTASEEIAALDGTLAPGWARTGETFNVYATSVPSTASCRFCAPPRTADGGRRAGPPAGCGKTATRFTNAWPVDTATLAEPALPNADGSCTAGSVPVFRMVDNRPDLNNRYTASLAIRDAMLAAGWAGQGRGALGVALCAPSPQ